MQDKAFSIYLVLKYVRSS